MPTYRFFKPPLDAKVAEKFILPDGASDEAFDENTRDKLLSAVSREIKIAVYAFRGRHPEIQVNFKTLDQLAAAYLDYRLKAAHEMASRDGKRQEYPYLGEYDALQALVTETSEGKYKPLAHKVCKIVDAQINQELNQHLVGCN